MKIMDTAQRDLDEAAKAYRRAYNRGYSLSERGFADKAQAVLDKANFDYDAAKAAFAKERLLTDGHFVAVDPPHHHESAT